MDSCMRRMDERPTFPQLRVQGENTYLKMKVIVPSSDDFG